ncbi:unnamed protein product [Prunus armeniaca]|uniref:Reverse transcriptase domain-containing protein n=1 Tax=Prunus armeniaca TaxID=36596 RepID=A0A6J5TXB8_PRUAR|nr:unnamed protein product [Prunus armeniaca]
MWTDELAISLRSASNNHIDTEVEVLGVQGRWRFTGFYGCPVTAERHRSWDLLIRLGATNSLPWLCCGDFNEILTADEKTGGRTRGARQMQGFRHAVDECGFKDLGFSGPKFTWWRNSPEEIRIRLDRALATTDWCTRFPGTKVLHLNPTKSDHLPIRITISKRMLSNTRHRNLFRFEEMWVQHENCMETIREEWLQPESGSAPRAVTEKLKRTRLRLLGWSRGIFGSLPHQIKSIQTKLGELLEAPLTPQTVETRKELTAKLDSLMAKNEIYWRQRSRALWLKAGDRNTKYFHYKASSRKRRNTISGLEDENGIWQTSEPELENTVVHYFQQLFSSNGNTDYEEVADVMRGRVSEEMNRKLLADFTAEEIKHALFQMHPSKAPGPDGFSPLFYQQYWDVVGVDVVSAILHFLHTGQLLKRINYTHVALIPKVPDPKNMTQLRPISLRNVLYKIGAKVLANRLKVILPALISDSQSAFVPGRMISDNSIVAFELLHFMHKRTHGRQGYMALKLDMSKAYDRVEWNFLESLMLVMGFDRRWVQLIMACLTSVSYSFLLNGNPVGYVIPQRGLRQGDPLSPYLFLLCAEAFSGLIVQAEQNGTLHGVSLCRGAPTVSHLFFADDSFLFLKASQSGCAQLKQILQCYEQVSGQKINLDKSCVSFSRNVADEDQELFATTLRVRRVAQHDRYLGLPTHIGRSRGQCFNYLKDCIWKKIQGWKAKLLSFAGKEVLLKVVAQALPIYMMSCFLIPKFLCEEIQQMMASYWWGAQEGRRKIHWLSWKNLCRPKHEGGLGFRNLYAFNLALVAKQVWRLAHNPHSLVARLLKARYYRDCSILEATLGNSPSYVWRSLCQAKVVLERGSRWRIGDGQTVRIWEDRWLPTPVSFKVLSTPVTEHGNTCVSFLIDPVTLQWKTDILGAWFSAEEAAIIHKIPLSFRQPPDTLIWHFERHGHYSVKSGYEVARQYLLQLGGDVVQTNGTANGITAPVWRKIWEVRVPPKVRLFLWRAMLNILPTKVNLKRRGVAELGGCVFCGEEETGFHVFVQCPMAEAVWHHCSCWGSLQRVVAVDLTAWFQDVALTLSAPELEQVMICMWALWNERNQVVWNDRWRSVSEIVSGAIRLLHDCYELQPPLIPPSRVKAKWQRPPLGSIKINLGEACRGATGTGGIGVVVRDHVGTFLACKLVVVQGVSNLLHAKLLALKEGLLFAQRWPYVQRLIEGVGQGVGIVLSQVSQDLSHFGCLVDDCKLLLVQQGSILVQHVMKEANEAAARLARIALHSHGATEWFGDPPSSFA